MDRRERRLAAKSAKRVVATGLDPSALNPFIMVELVHQLHERLEQAKRNGNVDGLFEYLTSKIDLTLAGMNDIPIACGKGCSHCCNIWVSVTAPEALYIAKRLPSSATANVEAAHEATRAFSHDERINHPFPCPLLHEDNTCSVYSIRPLFCRLAASGDAEVCRRSYLNFTDEDIPTPAMYLFGREAYSPALAVALKAARRPHLCYEMNSALHRCLTTPNAEEQWLSGVDIFSGVLWQGYDTMELPANQYLYDLAFPRKQSY